VRVRDCRYQGSQPWPFPASLMLGFIARAEPDEPVVGDELEDARWFDRDEVRAALARDWQAAAETGEGKVISSPVSNARWLVEHRLDGRAPGEPG
jgi:NAD+ diphosphatase